MKGKKVVPQMVAGFILTILVWAGRYFGQIEVPAEVAVAAAGLMAMVVSFLTPDAIEADSEG